MVDNLQANIGVCHPATSAQKRIWLLQELNPEASAYNVVLPLQLRGTVDVGRLQNALERLFASHPILGTVYKHDGSTIVVSYRPLKSELFTSLSNPPPISDMEARRIVEDNSKKEFDLENGPLFRIELLNIKNSEYVLLLVFHHIVCDGISLSVIADQLSREYAGEAGELVSEYSYREYALAEANYLESTEYIEDIKYWEEKLDGMSASVLPSTRKRTSERSSGEHKVYWLNPGLSEKLRILARENNATRFQLLASIFAITLYRFTGQEDIAFGCIVNGRVDQRFSRTVGLFGNSVVLRRKVNDTEAFIDHLRGWRDNIVTSTECSRVPFERVVEVVAPSREKGVNPLFRVMLDFQGAERAIWRLDGASVSSMDFESHVAQFDFKCMLIDDGARISIGLEHRTDLYSRTDMDSFADEFERLCRSVALHSASTVGEIISARADQLWKLSIETGSTQELLKSGVVFSTPDGPNLSQVLENQEPLHESMHPLIRVSRQVESKPTETAVEDSSGSMTYEDL